MSLSLQNNEKSEMEKYVENMIVEDKTLHTFCNATSNIINSKQYTDSGYESVLKEEKNELKTELNKRIDELKNKKLIDNDYRVKKETLKQEFNNVLKKRLLCRFKDIKQKIDRIETDIKLMENKMNEHNDPIKSRSLHKKQVEPLNYDLNRLYKHLYFIIQFFKEENKSILDVYSPKKSIFSFATRTKKGGKPKKSRRNKRKTQKKTKK